MEQVTFTRVTPEPVLEAYKKNNMKPVRRQWMNAYMTADVSGKQKMVLCGCALATLIHQKDPAKFKELLQEPPYRKHQYVADELGLPLEYVQGFTSGFDGGEPCDEGLQAVGYQDGAAVWQALEKAGLSQNT